MNSESNVNQKPGVFSLFSRLKHILFSQIEKFTELDSRHNRLLEKCTAFRQEIERIQKLSQSRQDSHTIELIELYQLIHKMNESEENIRLHGKIIENRIRNTLAQSEIMEFSPLNEMYNYLSHEIIECSESSEEISLSNLRVMKVIRVGYKHNDKILLKARVQVGSL